jgi:hypothetical protein
VRSRMTISEPWRRLKRRWQMWRPRLRRERATIALLALLTLGFFEPLICILHCQIWLPIALHSYFAAQHPHQRADHALHASPAQPARETEPTAAQPSSDQRWCFMDAGHGAPSDRPSGVPPSPVHEMIPVLVVTLVVALLRRSCPIAPPGTPPGRSFPPPLRPPILLAV